MVGKLIVEDDAMMKEDAMMEEKEKSSEEGITEEEDLAMGDPIEQELTPEDFEGIYMDYSESGLSETENTVLFFHANWCPSCRALDKGLLEDTIPENLTILKVDYDTQTELRKKYGIVSQHTLVQVDNEGNEIKKWLGGNGVDDILERME